MAMSQAEILKIIDFAEKNVKSTICDYYERDMLGNTNLRRVNLVVQLARTTEFIWAIEFNDGIIRIAIDDIDQIWIK